jgi:hypothetical protein
MNGVVAVLSAAVAHSANATGVYMLVGVLVLAVFWAIVFVMNK